MTPKTKKWLGAAIKALTTLQYVVDLESTRKLLADNLDELRINVAHRLITNVLRHNGYWYNYQTQRMLKLEISRQVRKTLPEPNLSIQDEYEGNIKDRLFVAFHKTVQIMVGSELEDFIHALSKEGLTLIKTEPNNA